MTPLTNSPLIWSESAKIQSRKPASPLINVTYLIVGSPQDAHRIARDIALEQTVEVPEALVLGTPSEQLVAEVRSVEAADSGRCLITLAYRAELASGHLQQLLNLIYGNISIKNGIRLVDIELPDEFLAQFAGPRYGIDGVRAQLGVYGRPLVATALKPRGSSLENLANLATDFALAGGDIVKDDHNLADADFGAFVTRVRTIQHAVDEANRQTGYHTLYFPNVSVPVQQWDSAMAAAREIGAAGVLVAPALAGLDFIRLAAERYGRIVAAHPTFYGTFFQDPAHGINPSVLLGTLQRLAGADISIFPNSGGRFGFTHPECGAIAEALRRPLGHLLPAWPAPAGGMTLDKVGGMCEQYGESAVFLLGGALLGGGSVHDSTTRFLNALKERFGERRGPARESDARCQDAKGGVLDGSPEFSWIGRAPIPYKGQKRLPFEGISRVELFGKGGEASGFDVRYFEIQPGGFSSREKHQHTHCVIIARGSGVVSLNGDRTPVKPNDIVHVPPMVIHQFLNESDEPFGFYCVVDRHRDRPLAP